MCNITNWNHPCMPRLSLRGRPNPSLVLPSISNQATLAKSIRCHLAGRSFGDNPAVRDRAFWRPETCATATSHASEFLERWAQRVAKPLRASCRLAAPQGRHVRGGNCVRAGVAIGALSGGCLALGAFEQPAPMHASSNPTRVSFDQGIGYNPSWRRPVVLPTGRNSGQDGSGSSCPSLCWLSSS